MKHGLTALTLAGALIFSLALARNPITFTVNDSGINYTDTDTSQAFFQLTFEGDHFVVNLSDTELSSILPQIDFDIPSLRDDDDGNAHVARLSNINDVDLERVAGTYHRLKVTHPHSPLNKTIDDYVATMNDLGFRMVREGGTFNVRVLAFEGEAGNVNVKLIRDGNNVVATLTGF